jgi:hypothetical protein
MHNPLIARTHDYDDEQIDEFTDGLKKQLDHDTHHNSPPDEGHEYVTCSYQRFRLIKLVNRELESRGQVGTMFRFKFGNFLRAGRQF